MKYILFGFQTSTEYEYEYYSGLENPANTNTNIFGFEKSSKYEYEYYSVWKYLPNTNTNITIQSQLFEYYSNTELFAHLRIQIFTRLNQMWLFIGIFALSLLGLDRKLKSRK